MTSKIGQMAVDAELREEKITRLKDCLTLVMRMLRK